MGPVSGEQREVVGTQRWYYYTGQLNEKDKWFRRCCLFAGKTHPQLADDVARFLGVPLSNARVARFADSEVSIDVLDSVRGCDVFVLQSVSRGFPNISVNDSLMELTLFVSALRRASARSITAILPYYGYARQDRRLEQAPIAAADVAQILTAAGLSRLVAMDLHSGQIQGFFPPSVPVDNLSAVFVAAAWFAEQGLHEAVVVSPDAGGVTRAKEFRNTLHYVGRQIASQRPGAGADHGPSTPSPPSEAPSEDTDASQKLAMLIKQRSGASKIERMDLVGSVDGQDVILIDDILDTAGTLCGAAMECKRRGARRVFAFCTHGLLSGSAARKLAEACAAGDLEYIVVSNTVPQQPWAEWEAACGDLPPPRLKVLSVAALLAEVIKRLAADQSLELRFASRL